MDVDSVYIQEGRMAPLVFLVLGSALARVLGLAGVDALDGWSPALRVGLALMFTVTGVAHFVGMRQQLIAMVPPQLPAAGQLVTTTGVLELAGAVGLLVPATATAAALCLAALLIVMFPANLHLATTGTDLPFDDRLVPRTLLQIVFLAACVGAAL
jgi:uncharacterized membrane protein